jgi:hypothetical protein
MATAPKRRITLTLTDDRINWLTLIAYNGGFTGVSELIECVMEKMIPKPPNKDMWEVLSNQFIQENQLLYERQAFRKEQKPRTLPKRLEDMGVSSKKHNEYKGNS